jgi:hypothetical protein
LINDILNLKAWVVGCLNDGLETLVGHIEMHLFNFFVDLLGWLVMQYKVSPTNLVWSPIDAFPIRLLIQMGHQSCIPKCLALFHTTQFGAMMHQGLWREKNLLVLDCPNTLIFGRWASHKAQHMTCR